jgi:hypothetical protein
MQYLQLHHRDVGRIIFPASRHSCEASQLRVSIRHAKLSSATFLMVTPENAIPCLCIADGCLNFPFLFCVFIADQLTRDLLDFTLRFLDSTFDPVFVHDRILIAKVGISSKRNIAL